MDRYLQGTVLWPPGRTRLRVYYVPPAEPIKPLVDAYGGALAPFDFIAPVAGEWLHATIAALHDRFASEVTPRQLSAVESRLRHDLGDLPEFTVQAGGALASRHGVTLDLTPDQDFVELIRRASGVFTEIFDPAAADYDGGRPHIALAYGTGRGDSGLVQGRLRNATDLRVPLKVAEVLLVEVSQDAVHHHVRWRELAQIPLAPQNEGET